MNIENFASDHHLRLKRPSKEYEPGPHPDRPYIPGRRGWIPIEQITFHLAGLGVNLEKGPVADTVDAECELDFGLGMGGEVIKRALLAGELAK